MNLPRITEKVKEVEQCLRELSTFLPDDFSDYEDNIEKKAACERYFEKIVEALVDLAFLIIKHESWIIPEEDTRAFDLLRQEKIISEELAQRLKEAKGMRNILVHEYGIVDDQLVFEAVTVEIEQDAEAFLQAVKKKYRGKRT